jgi:hypothetical protein
LAFQIGFLVAPGPFPRGLDGRIRLVSVINGALWSEEEILEQYNRPYAYYGPFPPPITAELAIEGLGTVVLLPRTKKMAGLAITGLSAVGLAGHRGTMGKFGVTGESDVRIPSTRKTTFAELGIDGESDFLTTARKLSFAELAIDGETDLIILPSVLVPVPAEGREFCIPAVDRSITVSADGSINCMATICVAGCDVSFFTKDPVAKLDYTWNWAGWLGADTIENATFTADPGLTITAQEFDETTATVGITGGDVFHTYQVACTIQTLAGRTDKRTALFLIQQQ